LEPQLIVGQFQLVLIFDQHTAVIHVLMAVQVFVFLLYIQATSMEDKSEFLLEMLAELAIIEQEIYLELILQHQLL
jgi:hypothetical protein